MNAQTTTHRERKQAIREFMRVRYTDEKLAELLAHAQSGRLAFMSCCCFVGVSNSNHPLRGKVHGFNTVVGDHYDYLIDDALRSAAEDAYRELARVNSARRRILIPMIRAEMRRRDRAVVIQEAVAHA